MKPMFQGVPLIHCQDLPAGEAIVIPGGLSPYNNARRICGHWASWETLLTKGVTLARMGMGKNDLIGLVIVNFGWLVYAADQTPAGAVPIDGVQDFIESLRLSQSSRRCFGGDEAKCEPPAPPPVLPPSCTSCDRGVPVLYEMLGGRLHRMHDDKELYGGVRRECDLPVKRECDLPEAPTGQA